VAPGIRLTLRTAFGYLTLVGCTAALFAPICGLGLLGWYRAVDALIVLWSRAFLRSVGVRWEVRGAENAAGLGPCVILSSHRSHLDGPLLLCTLPLNFAFVIKRSLARIPLWGWAVTGAGYVAIDRHDHADSLAGMRRAADAVRSGRRVLIFPEGTRSDTDDFLPFKKGGVVLAIEAGVPVLPVAVAGTREILPRGLHNATFRGGPTVVCIGRPIPTAGMTYEDRSALLAAIEADIRRLHAEANARLRGQARPGPVDVPAPLIDAPVPPR